MAVEQDGLMELEAQLGAPAPPGVAELPAAQLRHLAGSIHAARRRDTAELATAGDQAFAYVPRLLRGPIRKLLG
jgi:hypothetical protein